MAQHRTKWEILVARRDEAQRQLDLANRRLEALENTPCELNCGGCGLLLETEADFAKHFPVYDERFLNLGYCSVEGPNPNYKY